MHVHVHIQLSDVMITRFIHIFSQLLQTTQQTSTFLLLPTKKKIVTTKYRKKHMVNIGHHATTVTTTWNQGPLPVHMPARQKLLNRRWHQA